MNKCLTTSDLNEVNDYVSQLEARIDANANQIAINSEIRDQIVEVSTMPKQMQELSLNLLKLENNITENMRIVDNNTKRLDNFEVVLKRSEGIKDEMMAKQEVGELCF